VHVVFLSKTALLLPGQLSSIAPRDSLSVRPSWEEGRRRTLIPGPCYSGQRVVRLQFPTYSFRKNWKHDFFLGLLSLLLMFIALILAFCIGVFSVLLLEAFLLYKWWTLTGKDARKLYPQRTRVTNPEVGSLRFRQNTSAFILFTCRSLNPVIFNDKKGSVAHKLFSKLRNVNSIIQVISLN